MKNFLTVVIFLFTISLSPLFSQKQVKLKKAQRVLEYIDLSEEENLPFYYRDLGYLNTFCSKVFRAEIPSYDKEKSLESPLQIKEVFKKFIINNESSNFEWIPLYYGRDFYVLCFDKTVGTFKGEIKEQINWVHFYVEKDDYKFSVRFSDFIKVVAEQEELYVKNTKGAFWNNNIFLTHGDYMVDYQEFHKYLLKKAIKQEELSVIDHYTKKEVPRSVLKPFADKDYWGYNLFLEDSIVNGRMVIGNVGYEYFDDPYLWGKNKRYSFSWNKSKPLEEKVIPVYKLEDAFRFGLYHTFKTEKSKAKASNISFSDERLVPYKGTLQTYFLEAVLTSQPENKVFQTIYPDFMEQLVDSTLRGKITPYFNDSLNSPVTIEEFVSFISKRLSYEYNYSTEMEYFKGDTVEHDLYRYRAKQDIKRKTTDGWGESEAMPIYWNTPLDTSVWEIIPKERYDLSEIEDLECNFEMTFNKYGGDVKMELDGITIFISSIATGNEKGIQYPISSYKWEDVKKLFPDPKFVDYIENRKYFSYFLKTDLVKARGEK